MLVASVIFSAFLSLCPKNDFCDTAPKSAAAYRTVAYECKNQQLIEIARERARMLRNNELVTENPIDNAILYKKLKTMIAAYEAGKISESVFHTLVAEFQSISYTGTIYHQMANEWLDEYRLYLK